MARRDLLNELERRALFGVPETREDLARHYMLSSRDLALVASKRGDTNRLGFAVQLALLRHPGFGFMIDGGAPAPLVAFMGEQIGAAASAFDGYAVRPATASVHAREAEGALGLRQPTNADLPLLIEAGARAAWSTDRGPPIVVGITDALRASCITLPSPSVIERAGIAGRARARQRTYDALLAAVSAESAAKLDALLIVDPHTGLSRLHGYARSPTHRPPTMYAACSTAWPGCATLGFPLLSPTRSTLTGCANSFAKGAPRLRNSSGATHRRDGARRSRR